MQAQVLLPEGCLRIEPGNHAVQTFVVRNLGLAAERFTFEVIGAPASWTTVDPPMLLLGPDSTGRVELHFRPPKAAHVRAGRVPYGVLTTSASDSSSSVVEQLLEIGAFADTSVELVPRAARRASATFRVLVANRGNATVRAEIRGRDATGAVRVDCVPAQLTVFPGGVGESLVRVQPLHRYWCGPPRSHPFQVVVDSGADLPLVATGVLVHRAVLPT